MSARFWNFSQHASKRILLRQSVYGKLVLSLKAEKVYLTEYETIEDVLKSVLRFTETVYHDERLHSSLGYFGPAKYEELVETGQLKNQGLDPTMQLTGKPFK